MSLVEKEYGEFVAGKLKDPAAIAAYLGENPAVCNAIHLAMGVMGEAVELMTSTSLDNTIEELGDIEFYLEGFTAMGWADPHTSAPYSYNFTVINQDTVVRNIVEDAGMLLDRVKKIAMYQKPADVDELKEICGNLHLGLERMYIGLNVSRERVLQQNKDKLNKRYAGGYSDKAAQDRADKKGTGE